MAIDPRTFYDHKGGDWGGFKCIYEGQEYKFCAVIKSIEADDNHKTTLVEVVNPPLNLPARIPLEWIEGFSPVHCDRPI